MKHIRCRWMKINAVAMTKPDQSGISVCGRVSTATGGGEPAGEKS